MSNPLWTPDQDAQLRELWAQEDPRLSCNDIARRMQKTKNSVVGRAHRLHLAARPSPVHDRAAYPALVARPRKLKAPPKPRLPPHWDKGVAGLARAKAMAASPFLGADLTKGLQPAPASPVARANPIRAAESLEDTARTAGGGSSLHAARHPVFAGARSCRFPLWADKAAPDGRFCDAPVVRGAYCAAHGARCYEAPRPLGPAPAPLVVGWRGAA
jgi:GcrA cell cycle regulator